jgi:alkylhydroperoxidase family enzyme
MSRTSENTTDSGTAGSPAWPRLAPLEPARRTEEQRQLLAPLYGDDAPNLFSTVAWHPALFRTWLPFCMHFLTHSVFPPREREFLIIRAAWLCGSAYELTHHLSLGSEAGLSDRDLGALTSDGSPDWTPREELLVAAVNELHANQMISDATWQGLRALLTIEQLVELPMLVGHYVLLAGMLRSLGVPVESAQQTERLRSLGMPENSARPEPNPAR